jgi:hypothetical protein
MAMVPESFHFIIDKIFWLIAWGEDERVSNKNSMQLGALYMS